MEQHGRTQTRSSRVTWALTRSTRIDFTAHFGLDLDIRPVRHRLRERIRAHVLLCWLAMLLVRVAENESGRTWFQIRKALDKLQVGTHRTRAGEVLQANNPNDELKELFEILELRVPPRILSLPIPRGDRV